MAGKIKYGESIYIPFVDGESVLDSQYHLYCSVCYKTYAKNAKWVNELDLPTNYCPSCGARMGKEDEHEVAQPARRSFKHF